MEVKNRKQVQKTGEKSKRLINCLYSYFKNSPKKLKIICDWDEVIQTHEPYALWLTSLSKEQKKQEYTNEKTEFSEYFKIFWGKLAESWINYSPYGSRLITEGDTEKLNQQQIIKNSPNFYQQASFLTIAKELLLLIRDNKVEKLIFLTAYDKRKFPKGDFRKLKIFQETFGKFSNCSLQLIGFESDMNMNQTQGKTKADWIKENASDFDIVIDDNPLICKSIVESHGSKINVCCPYYPSIIEKHHPNVILIKTSISNLEKKDFNKS